MDPPPEIPPIIPSQSCFRDVAGSMLKWRIDKIIAGCNKMV